MGVKGWIRVAVAALTLAGLSACGAQGSASAGSSAPASSTTVATPAAPSPASGASPWPAPRDPAARVADAGLALDRREYVDFHHHAHLDVFVNGTPVTVPAAIGIDRHNPGIQSFPPLGAGHSKGWGQRRNAAGDGGLPCSTPCLSPLHTHDDTGVIHIEAAAQGTYTLGQFFAEWGVPLTARCVGGYCAPDASIAVYVDGTPYPHNPAGLKLRDLQEIAIVIGTPPADIPSTADFSFA